MQCVILAGGLGKRMAPFTERLPKSMIPVCGRPFIEHQLEWLERGGVKRALFCLGHMAEPIESCLRSRPNGQLQISIARDGGQVPAGTAGALRQAHEAELLEERFLLTYGDSLLPISFTSAFEAFCSGPSPALMTVHRNLEGWERNNAAFEKGRVVRYAKGAPDRSLTHVDYGLLGFSRKLVERDLRTPELSDLSHWLERLAARGELAGYEVTAPFFEVGSPAGLARLEDWLNRRTGGRSA